MCLLAVHGIWLFSVLFLHSIFIVPGQDYGLESTFGVEKTVIIENKFTFSCIEIPLSKGIWFLFSLLFFLFDIPKSFKTIAACINSLLIPPCRVREISDPPITQVGVLKSSSGFCHKGNMHTNALLRLPKDLINRINSFTYHLQGRQSSICSYLFYNRNQQK